MKDKIYFTLFIFIFCMVGQTSLVNAQYYGLEPPDQVNHYQNNRGVIEVVISGRTCTRAGRITVTVSPGWNNKPDTYEFDVNVGDTPESIGLKISGIARYSGLQIGLGKYSVTKYGCTFWKVNASSFSLRCDNYGVRGLKFIVRHP